MQSMRGRNMMPDTSIRVKAETYQVIIKTRGAFEQTFGHKLTLDDAVYLAGSYINVAYDVYQELEKDGLMKIVPDKKGSFNIKWARVDKILDKGIPRLMTAFDNLKKMLSQKQASQVISGAVS